VGVDDRIEDLARGAAHYHVLDIPKIRAKMALLFSWRATLSEWLLGQ
jgi:hypothetical protein